MRRFNLTICMVMVTVLSFAQQQNQANSTRVTTPNNSATNSTTASDSLKAIQFHNIEVNRQVTQIDSHVNSIQIKWNYIMNNPTEKQLAEENGWFEDMTRIKGELAEKKQLLIDSLQ